MPTHSIFPSLPQALASLAEAAYEAAGGDDDPPTYHLSPHFGDVIKNLVETADRYATFTIICIYTHVQCTVCMYVCVYLIINFTLTTSSSLATYTCVAVPGRKRTLFCREVTKERATLKKPFTFDVVFQTTDVL